jgi:hypothetical protein
MYPAKYKVNNMYKIGTYKEKEVDKQPDYLSRIETKVSFTRKEIEENLLEKQTTMECVVKYNGKERKGIILSFSTSGNYVIGILKED